MAKKKMNEGIQIQHSVLDKINDRYHYFSNSVKKVADYILMNPRNLIHLPITELAEQIGVSEYTIMKLCKSINLSGYQELKILLSKELVNPLENIHEKVSEHDPVSEIVCKLSDSYQSVIELTKKTVDPNAIEQAAEAINKARKLEFYGMGGSASVAKDAYHKFFRLIPDCRYLEDGHMQAMSAAMFTEHDVAVAISHSGSTKDLVEALKLAKEAGATTICITSQLKSPITKVADIKLMTPSIENYYRNEPMENRIAQIYILDILFVTVALKKKDFFLTNLEKTRKSLVNKKY